MKNAIEIYSYLGIRYNLSLISSQTVEILNFSATDIFLVRPL